MKSQFYTIKLLLPVFIFISLTAACTKARYTNFKSFQYADVPKKEKQETERERETGTERKKERERETIGGTESNSSLSSDSLNQGTPGKTAEIKEGKLIHQTNEKSNGESKWKNKKIREKPSKGPKEYTVPKYNRMVSTYAVNLALIWFAGVVFLGFGGVFHLLLAAAIAIGILSVMSRR